jgi:hypothetical protein
MQQLNRIVLFVDEKKTASDNTAVLSNITELILLDYLVVVQHGKKISNFDLIILKRVNFQLCCTVYCSVRPPVIMYAQFCGSPEIITWK